EQAYKLDPQNAPATYGYGWLLQHTQKYEQAIPVLHRAMTQEANKLGALYLLGKSQLALSHWHEALNSFQQLLGAKPEYQEDKQLLKMVADCKRQLGYELTPAERKARRSWWPFGRKTKRATTLQGPPTLVRPGLRWAGLAILVVMVFSLGFYAWDKWTNIDVYFDNSLDKSVKVDLDGSAFDVALNSLHKEQLNSGSHTAIVRGTDGKEIERLTFSLEKLNPVSALMTDRFFVYNIGTRHIYRRASHGYAKNASDTSYSDDLIAMQRFFEQRDVDYPFESAPESIEADATSSVVHKTSFNIAKDFDLRKYALLRLQQGRKDEAKQAIARAVKLSPCDAQTRRTEIYFASLNSGDKAAETARQWIADCTQDDLEAHRAYQDAVKENGSEEALRGEYQKLVASSPQSAKAHYLYGRVAADTQTAITEYQQAIALDPQLVWPHVALGYAYRNLERFDDAMRELNVALDMKGCDPAVIVYYVNAAIAKGQPSEAVDKVDAMLKQSGRNLTFLHSRWMLALGANDWDEAMKIEKTLAPVENPQTAWWRTTKRMRLAGDKDVDARIDAAMRSNELQPIAVDFKIERSIEKGDYTQAAELISKGSKLLDPSVAALLDAYTAGGFVLQNDSASAKKLLDDAEKIAGTQPKSVADRIVADVVAGVRGTMAPEAVLNYTRDNDAAWHGWYVTAIRAAQSGDRRKASEAFEHCTRASSDLDFPYLESKAMAARLQ
ncbi:MAG TPA: tetratricopeptide repeat protein, partial [Thermoanaerobaculia bacterium]|nr:tetratricopeptide repeat protein [Thermoanaerobaculia bacterium]